MLRVAVAMLPLYPNVQTDLVLAGVFLHDIGKTEELSYDMAFSYTDSGQLIGHVVKSFVMVNQKADSLEAKGAPIDKTILDSLGHIILSHHGAYDYGSPKLPATPEAFMVYYIDELDANVIPVPAAMETDPPSGGSGTVFIDDIRLYPAEFYEPECPPLPPDLVRDGDINYDDLGVIVNYWLQAPPDPNFNLYVDGTINFKDMAEMGKVWGETQVWPTW